MQTECTPVQIEFKGLGRRKVRGAFDGGHISSDGGAVLLREGDARLGITAQIFIDGEPSHKSPGFGGLSDNEDYVFRIGDGEQGFIEAYKDDLRELRFYRAVLTEGQIKIMAEGGDPGVGDPVLHWKPGPAATESSQSPPVVTGPIRLQADTSRVRFANIWVQRLDYDGRTRELNFQGYEKDDEEAPLVGQS